MECWGCDTLDVENCTCVVDIECQCTDGIKDGNEEYLDCGGDCDPCTYACEFYPCRYLTNESTKVWIPVAVGDPEGNILPQNPTMELVCRVDHTAIFATNKTTWRFDDPSEPKLLIFREDDDEISSNLVFFSPDSPALYFPTHFEHVYYIPE